MPVSRRVEVLVYTLLALVYVAGLIYTSLLSTRPLVAQGVYIDENALLAGQAITAPQRIENMFSTDNLLYDCPHDLPTCISTLLAIAGWDVTFTPTPLNNIPANTPPSPYGLITATMRPPRTPGAETIVLIGQPPLRELSRSSSPSSLAILLEAARAAVAQRYLSRDLTLLIPIPPPLPADKPHLLSARALALSNDILAQGIALSPLQALPTLGLALEVPPHACGTTVSMIPGAYGGQGNLDVTSTAFNTFRMTSVASEPSVPPVDAVCAPFSHRTAARTPCNALVTGASTPTMSKTSGNNNAFAKISELGKNAFWDILSAVAQGWDTIWTEAGRRFWRPEGLGTARTMLWQLLGGAQGLHANLAIRGVDSVLVATVIDGTAADMDRRALGQTRCYASMQAVWRAMGEGAEQWIHSASNLHERLHHSLWLHLLGSSLNFTAMGKYIPAFLLLWAPSAAALIWTALTWGSTGSGSTSTAVVGGNSGETHAISSKLSSTTSTMSLGSATLPAFLALLMAALLPLLSTPDANSHLLPPLYLALLLGLALLARRPHHPALALAPAALLLAPISLLSFSLALAIAALLTPALLLALALSRAALPLRILGLPVLTLLSPLTLLLLPRLAALAFDYNALLVPCALPHSLLSPAPLAEHAAALLEWAACLLQSPLLHLRAVMWLHAPAWVWAAAVTLWGTERRERG